MTRDRGSRLAVRVRFFSRTMLVLLLVGWVAWFWPFDDWLDGRGTPLGADFSMFYVAGQVVADGAGERLYDQAEHQRRLQQLFPKLDSRFCLPYRYPPAVAWCLSPLARLPYPVAWGVFTTSSLLAMVFIVRTLIGQRLIGSGGGPATESSAGSPSWRSTAAWCLVGWPVGLEVLIGGQASWLACSLLVASLLQFRRERWALAGAFLACSLYKPNVLALFTVGMVARQPRLLRGLVPVGLAILVWQMAVAQPLVTEYLNLSRELAAGAWSVETPYWKVHSLAPLLDFVFPGRGKLAALLVGGTAALVIGAGWRHVVARCGADRARHAEVDCWALALLLAVNALGNPYTPLYDLVLLGVGAWLVAEGLVIRREQSRVPLPEWAAQLVLAVGWLGPHFSQSLAPACGIQLFPLLLCGLVAGLAWYRFAPARTAISGQPTS